MTSLGKGPTTCTTLDFLVHPDMLYDYVGIMWVTLCCSNTERRSMDTEDGSLIDL